METAVYCTNCGNVLEPDDVIVDADGSLSGMCSRCRHVVRDYFDIYDFDEFSDSEDPCDRCGPWCECWGGDGLCMLAIEQQAQEAEQFYKKYVSDNQPCPHCGKELTRYHIPVDRLWFWPGEWPDGEHYNPMIALDIFAVIDAPKGEVHKPVQGRFYRFHHIWVGQGQYRSEKLIMLNKEMPDGQ